MREYTITHDGFVCNVDGKTLVYAKVYGDLTEELVTQANAALDLAAVTAQRDALLEAMRSIEWSDSYQMCVDLARAAISTAERKEP